MTEAMRCGMRSNSLRSLTLPRITAWASLRTVMAKATVATRSRSEKRSAVVVRQVIQIWLGKAHKGQATCARSVAKGAYFGTADRRPRQKERRCSCRWDRARGCQRVFIAGRLALGRARVHRGRRRRRWVPSTLGRVALGGAMRWGRLRSPRSPHRQQRPSGPSTPMQLSSGQSVRSSHSPEPSE